MAIPAAFGLVIAFSSERGADHRPRRLDAHGVLDLLLDGLALGILERELHRDLQVEARRPRSSRRPGSSVSL